jgi:hypothetical protein
MLQSPLLSHLICIFAPGLSMNARFLKPITPAAHHFGQARQIAPLSGGYAAFQSRGTAANSDDDVRLL